MGSNIWLILISLVSYLLGSLPSSYFITQKMAGEDIRLGGSGNIGAMNAYRLIRDEKSTSLAVIGFILALTGDMGKGVLAIFVARWLNFLGYNLGLALIISGFFVVLGHNYSVFFKFRQGGRGISSLGGVVLALNPLAFLIGLGTLLFSILLTQYLLVARINWRKFSELFSVAGSQVVGRVIGLAIALIPLYFFGLELFLPALAADALVLIKHVERVKAYIGELGASRGKG